MKHHPFNALPSNLDPKWILDIGANRGSVALAALHSYPQVHVVCVEPVNSVFQELLTTLEPFKDRVTVANLAVSNCNARGEIFINTYSPASSLSPQAELHKISNPQVRETGERQVVALHTLEALATVFPSKRFDIVKIDVEGHEINVLEGGPHFFRNCVEFVIIEISMHRDRTFQDQAVFRLFEIMRSYEFYLYNIYDVYPDSKSDLMLAQFDCIFRNTRFLAADRK